MKQKKVLSILILVLVAFCLTASQALACTILAVGKGATVDGSTIVTHNDDSTGADFRLWIIPGGTWEEGAVRDLVIDSHNYGDYGQYPTVKDYGNGYKIAEIPEASQTYAYFHSRYSFVNEKGVGTSESTFTTDWRSTPERQHIYQVLYGTNNGLIDCWNAQDIALERATTAREAVRIMGDLVEAYGWRDTGETIPVVDGNEVWVAEFYGLDLWCAVRIPEDAYFAAANRARIDYVDFNDPENYMWAPNLVSFAIENGLWSEDSGKPFSPAEVYAPYDGAYATRREWRCFDLVAPSLNLDPEALRFPLWVVPEQKLSVQDVWNIKADYYQGTPYDVSNSPEAGPYGDVLNPYHVERTINLFRTCYLSLVQIKGWLPDEVKCLVWYGYGAPDSSYLTPLWPTMTTLPEFYQNGSRYEDFRRDSGWWVSSYVQDTTRKNYRLAIQDLHAFRQPLMDELYVVVDEIQTVAARLIRQGNKDAALTLIQNFAYTTAVEMFNKWLAFGDWLTGEYIWGYKHIRGQRPDAWWTGIMNAAPDRPTT